MVGVAPLKSCLRKLEEKLANSDATEHTHRSSLEALIESLGEGVQAINEPRRIAAVEQALDLRFVPDGKGDLQETIGPEDILHYAYAVFHSPAYRERYAEFLKIDFPRLPLTSDRALFAALVKKGEELVALHLMESPRLDQSPVRFPWPTRMR
jgi:hypothetical protein